MENVGIFTNILLYIFSLLIKYDIIKLHIGVDNSFNLCVQFGLSPRIILMGTLALHYQLLGYYMEYLWLARSQAAAHLQILTIYHVICQV